MLTIPGVIGGAVQARGFASFPLTESMVTVNANGILSFRDLPIGGDIGAVDNALIRADGVTGDTLQGGSATLDDNGVLTLAGAIVLPNGSSSTPALRFAIASNVGLYCPSAGNFMFAAVNKGLLQIDYAGAKVVTASDMYYGWASSGGPNATNPDTSLRRVSAGVVGAAKGVDSSYGDLYAKEYRAHDSGGTKYVSTIHDGTQAKVESSSGNLHLIVPINGNQVQFKTATGNLTSWLSHVEGWFATAYTDTNNTNFSLSSSQGALCLSNAGMVKWSNSSNWYTTRVLGLGANSTTAVEVNNGTKVSSGGAYGDLYAKALRAYSSDGIKHVLTDHDGTNGNINCSSGNLNVSVPSAAFCVNNTAASGDVTMAKFYSATTGNRGVYIGKDDNTRIELNMISAGVGRITALSAGSAAPIRITSPTFTHVDSASSAVLISSDNSGISLARSLTMGDGYNYVAGTTTGSKFGTSALHKQAWWGATPVVQPSFIAAPTGGSVIDVEARAAIDSLRALLISVGFMAAA